MMFLQYTVCGVELPYPGLFPYLSLFPYLLFVQEFLQDLIPGLPYLVFFSYPGLFPYVGYFSFPGIFHFPIIFCYIQNLQYASLHIFVPKSIIIRNINYYLVQKYPGKF